MADDLRPLIYLLPMHGRHVPNVVLKSRITPETLTKFQIYAARIREVGYLSSCNKAHQSVWQFLAIGCKGSPLLPRLSSLDALGLLSNDLPALFLLLSPSIRSLSLSFEGDSWSNYTTSDVASVALQYIAQTAPGIESFRMLGFHRFSGKHLSALQNFAGLTELSLNPHFPLNGTMLRQLSITSSLTALTIAISRIGSTDSQPLSDGFRSVRDPTVWGNLKHLVNLTLRIVNDFIDPKKLRTSLASICEHPGLPRSLTRIGCEFHDDSESRYCQETLVQHFEPLLAFPYVRHCRLVVHDARPPVCDADLIRIGDAWDSLRHLDIRRRPTTDATRRDPDGTEYSAGTDRMPRMPAQAQRPTLAGLLALGHRCPSLTHVHLPELDARPCTLPTRHDASRLGQPLRELSFDSVRYGTSAPNPCAVADVVDLAFPRLDVPRSASEAAVGRLQLEARTDSAWRDVLKFVQAMQLGRDHLVPGGYRRPANLGLASDSDSDSESGDSSSLGSDSESSSDTDSSSSNTDSQSESSNNDPVDVEI